MTGATLLSGRINAIVSGMRNRRVQSFQPNLNWNRYTFNEHTSTRWNLLWQINRECNHQCREFTSLNFERSNLIDVLMLTKERSVCIEINIQPSSCKLHAFCFDAFLIVSHFFINNFFSVAYTRTRSILFVQHFLSCPLLHTITTALRWNKN